MAFWYHEHQDNCPVKVEDNQVTDLAPYATHRCPGHNKANAAVLVVYHVYLYLAKAMRPGGRLQKYKTRFNMKAYAIRKRYPYLSA